MHKKTHRKKKKVGSLFQPVKDKELHNLRRWKNDNWMGKSAKGWYNTTTTNPIMKAHERVTPTATQDFHLWFMPVLDILLKLKNLVIT